MIGLMSLSWLRWWATLLDSRFRIPGTSIRFGIDPILSLIPGLGELASPAFAVALILQGLRQRVPRVVIVRMIGNALIDACLGAIPIAGTVGDIFWRANTRNLALLEHYARPGRAPSRRDYVFVAAALIVFAAVLLVPVILAVWLFVAVWQQLTI